MSNKNTNKNTACYLIWFLCQQDMVTHTLRFVICKFKYTEKINIPSLWTSKTELAEGLVISFSQNKPAQHKEMASDV